MSKSWDVITTSNFNKVRCTFYSFWIRHTFVYGNQFMLTHSLRGMRAIFFFVRIFDYDHGSWFHKCKLRPYHNLRCSLSCNSPFWLLVDRVSMINIHTFCEIYKHIYLIGIEYLFLLTYRNSVFPCTVYAEPSLTRSFDVSFAPVTHTYANAPSTNSTRCSSTNSVRIYVSTRSIAPNHTSS